MVKLVNGFIFEHFPYFYVSGYISIGNFFLVATSGLLVCMYFRAKQTWCDQKMRLMRTLVSIRFSNEIYFLAILTVLQFYVNTARYWTGVLYILLWSNIRDRHCKINIEGIRIFVSKVCTYFRNCYGCPCLWMCITDGIKLDKGKK